MDIKKQTTYDMKTILIVAACILVAISVAVFYFLNQSENGFQKLDTPTGNMNTSANSGDNNIITDPTKTKPDEKDIKRVTEYMGKEKLDKATKQGLSPLQPVLGVYGAKVPVENDVQETFGPDSATIAPTALRIYEILWANFDSFGLHSPNTPSKEQYEKVFNTSQEYVEASIWNSLAKLAGQIPGKPKQWAGGIECFTSALGGASKDGTLPCAEENYPIGEGKWHMQVSAPDVKWGGKTEYQGSVKVTFVRTLYIPSKTPGKTIIAATPIALHMKNSNSSVPWKLIGIEYGTTTQSLQDGTWETFEKSKPKQ